MQETAQARISESAPRGFAGWPLGFSRGCRALAFVAAAGCLLVLGRQDAALFSGSARKALAQEAGKEAAPGKESPPARKEPGERIVLKGGSSFSGQIRELTEAKVSILVGGELKSFPRSEVTKVERACPSNLLTFFEEKYKEYSKAGNLTELKKLAEFCAKTGIIPERRRVIREIVRLEPDNAALRAELGDLLHEGKWLDEDEVAAKLNEGFALVEGKLVKAARAGKEREANGGEPPAAKAEPTGPQPTPASTTVVRKRGALGPGYKALPRQKLSDRDRKKLEKDRQLRIEAAERFLADKQKEYAGVPWSNRHKIRTRNFEIHCNSTEKVARAYGALMELIREKLAKMFPSKVQRNLRANVSIYANQEEFIQNDSYGRWAGRGIGGYYIPTNQQVTTYHGTFGFTGTTFSVLCHEGTHYYQGVVLKDFDNIPIWLTEGLAVYVGDGSVFDAKAVKIEIGQIPRDRLAHIQEKMLSRRHKPIRELITMDRQRGFTGSHYADAWALIYFLINSGDNGKKLLTAYWSIGLERQLTKKDFTDLADKYFGGMDALQKQYEEYILELQMPSAGKVLGDYFVSDVFQFDFKAPGDDWAFFEDSADKKLLVGLGFPGASAEIRIYYENNTLQANPEDFLAGYARYLKLCVKDYQQEPVKIAGLNGHKLKYLDDSRGGRELSEFEEYADQPKAMVAKRKQFEKDEPREVVEFKLVQQDGVVSILCSARKSEAKNFSGVFNSANENFTLIFTRRW